MRGELTVFMIVDVCSVVVFTVASEAEDIVESKSRLPVITDYLFAQW